MANKEETRKLTADEKKAEKQQKKQAKSGFFKGIKAELNKITWYPKKTTLISSVWVGIVLIVLGAIIGVIDAGLARGLSALAGLFA